MDEKNYRNDFMTDEDAGGFAPWQEQAISVPLHVHTDAIERRMEAEQAADRFRELWAQANERLRNVENELAAERGENRELTAIIDRLTKGEDDGDVCADSGR